MVIKENIEEILKKFNIFLKDTQRYSPITLSLYLKDTEQFLGFVNKSNINNLSKKDFSEFINFLKIKNLSSSTIKRKYFSIKSFALFLLKNYSINFHGRIYEPQFDSKFQDFVISKFILKFRNQKISSLELRNFLIFYLTTVLNIPAKTLIKLEKNDIYINFDYIKLSINKSKNNLNCKLKRKFRIKNNLEDIKLMFNTYLKNNNDFGLQKIFRLSYQAALSIKNSFTSNYKLINKTKSLNLNQGNSSLVDDIIKDYKKSHPRS
ncbi:site-specific integrase [Candidatus Babela massiliensis]|uniref:Site-specific recombinase XerD n=1 Tax=Candidatus Babela massiliensis TaxID=673862 RepID=V6DF01_9BACT|nr:site-specific integrase [Candidatus Babela massiliensis]CDK30177.1 Site-specific recombinase XerD [Candidatus Babela massiliensis]